MKDNITHNVATGTKHTACSTEHSLLLNLLEATRHLVWLPLLTNSTLLLPTFQSPLYVDYGLLRRTSSYFRDLTLIVTRVTLTSIRHL